MSIFSKLFGGSDLDDVFKEPNKMLDNGGTIYQNSMVVLGTLLLAIVEAEWGVYKKERFDRSIRLGTLFSKNYMQMRMTEDEIQNIFADMHRDIEEYGYSQVEHTARFSENIPLRVRKEIVVYLIMFDLLEPRDIPDQKKAVLTMLVWLIGPIQEDVLNKLLNRASSKLSQSGM